MWLVGKQPVELLAEPCAINGFDIDLQHPSVSCLCTFLCELVLSTYFVVMVKYPVLTEIVVPICENCLF